jgi:DNA-binding GntR family transcriptional regulator
MPKPPRPAARHRAAPAAPKRPAAAPGKTGGKTRLTEQAYRRIEEQIVTLKLAPGSAVSEQELSTALGIGRTPIREALQRLAREHLVSIVPHRGVLVSDVNVGEQLKVIEVRRELERLVARLAALRATPEQRAQLRVLAQRMLEVTARGDDMGFLALDNEFNKLVTSATRNQFARSAFNAVQALSRRFWFHHRIGDMVYVAQLHANIAIAVANGSVKDATAASDALMGYTEAFTRSTLDPIESE